jgi:hypothetical protein
MTEVERLKGTLKRALTTYGVDAQVISAAEECAELNAALLQSYRGRYPVVSPQVAEEVADVAIMLEQLRMIPGMANLVNAFLGSKMARLKERLDRGE